MAIIYIKAWKAAKLDYHISSDKDLIVIREGTKFIPS